MWVSDIIGDDYKKWEGRKVLLGFGTGRGKTRFALNIYSRYALNQGRSVLFLCNRKTLKTQIKDNIKLYGVSMVLEYK
ncbi:DEAD/DEAH box helicase family protein [Blautia sp. HCP3S3_G3]|uniref:DEAD/DEAH box helicase family protein n=1 Tax=Blautia sp. HCP3S3_G3 TaxID=3438913 RepID=UPI003F8B8AE4